MTRVFSEPPKRFTSRTDDHYIPANLCVKCPECHELIYRKQLEDNRKVCPQCAFHFRLTPCEWIALLLDPLSFQERDVNIGIADPPGLVEMQFNYAQELQQAQERTGLTEALVCGSGTIEGLSLEISITDFAFMEGTMGSVYGEKISRTIERAAERGVPLVTLNASAGARIHEGILALMQMAKIASVLALLARSRQPHLAVLIDACYGEVFASVSGADIILAEPGAHIGFAGPRVVEQTIRQKLPPDYQTSEFLLQHGMIDSVVPRARLRHTLARLLRCYHDRRPAKNAQPISKCVSGTL